MAERITQKKLKHDEFVEAAFDFEQWIEAHWKPVAGVAAGIVAVGLIAYGWVAFSKSANARSAAQLGEVLGKVDAAAGTPAATAGAWSAAMPTLEQVAKSGSDAAQTAEFYRGVALAQAGKLDEAMPVFESVHARGGVLGDLAQAKLAWAYAEKGQTDRAIETWKAIAADTESVVPPDVALYHEADLLAGQGKAAEAKTVLADLMAKYKEGSALVDARALQTELEKLLPSPAGATVTP